MLGGRELPPMSVAISEGTVGGLGGTPARSDVSYIGAVGPEGYREPALPGPPIFITIGECTIGGLGGPWGGKHLPYPAMSVTVRQRAVGLGTHPTTLL